MAGGGRGTREIMGHPDAPSGRQGAAGGHVTPSEELAPTPAPLNYDAIPIERHWEVSMLFHGALGHPDPYGDRVPAPRRQGASPFQFCPTARNLPRAMSHFFPAPSSRLGALRVDAVFEYYDSPVLFSCRDELNHAYLTVAAHGEGSITVYLYVPISEERLIAVRTGLVSLRDAFGQPETPVVFVVRSGPEVEEATVDEIAAADIPAEWLPDAGEFLSEKVETAARFSSSSLAALASRQNRRLIALEVDPPQAVRRTELPLTLAGPFLIEFEELAEPMTPSEELAPTPAPLNYDAIPIERHWEVSMLFHGALGHPDPWEVCDKGCDALAGHAIRLLFGAGKPVVLGEEEG